MSQSPCIRLRTARIAKGFTNAKQFSKQHNLNYATYIKHESGILPITEKTARKYADLLGVPFTWILTGCTIKDDPVNNNTTSISLKRKALEPILLPFAITTILKSIGKFDKNIDYELLFEKCKNIIAQILSNTDDIEKSKDIILTLSTIHSDELKQSILKCCNK